MATTHTAAERQPAAPGEVAAAVEAYVAPRSLAETVELLRTANVTILAGGTDLMPQRNAGRLRPQPVLMNIRRLDELRGISETKDGIRLGALTTMTELLESAVVKTRLTALWQAADKFASDQLRNMATIGGNICNASPAGDTLVPLLIFNAHVVLATMSGGSITTRVLALAEFLVGPGRTQRRPNELLTAVEVPAPPPGFVSVFFKFGARPALDIATISIGFGAVRNGDRLSDVRVSFGAVAPTPIRAPKTEAALADKSLPAAVEAALAAADAEVRPISDIRASAWYRRELVRNILRRMLNHVGAY